MDAVCRATPKEKITQETIRAMRRPSLSANGAAVRAPTTSILILSSSNSQTRRSSLTESSSGQNRDNSGGLRRAKIRVAFGVGCSSREFLLEVWHSQDTGNRSSVISEENTTESHEETDDNGRPGLPRHVLRLLECQTHD